jgi:hypothetical protein
MLQLRMSRNGITKNAKICELVISKSGVLLWGKADVLSAIPEASYAGQLWGGM